MSSRLRFRQHPRQLGDLIESLIKRSVGVKDSGVLRPVTAGMPDRIDALLWLCPTSTSTLSLRFLAADAVAVSAHDLGTGRRGDTAAAAAVLFPPCLLCGDDCAVAVGGKRPAP